MQQDVKKIRVIQWFTGDIACHQIRLINACPLFELVGAFVYHSDKAGRDVGDIAGIGKISVLASNDIEATLALQADVVLYNPPTDKCYQQVIQILASGKNVISIMSSWNPKKLDCYDDILAACEKGGSSLYGTGLNPGLSYELALLASSCCTDIDSVYIKTCEPQASLSEVFLHAFGFGQSEQALQSGEHPAYAIFENLLQITDLIAEKLQLPHDASQLDCVFEPATQDYLGTVTVRKGTMAGLLVKAQTTHRGRAVATIELRFLLGPEYVREQFLQGRPSQGWIEVDVRGTPGSKITHELYMENDSLGTWSTGTRAINAIPAVCAAPPGLLSPLDLPLSSMLALKT